MKQDKESIGKLSAAPVPAATSRGASKVLKELIKQDITEEIWKSKYRFVKPDGTSDENSIEDTQRRIVNGVYEKDPNIEAKASAFEALVSLEWLPGGRINAGAGTDKRVTLINCFVNQNIPDSMDGIMDSLTIAAITQQQGGGIGQDFSTLRPKGAIVRRTGSISRGPIPFMDMWNAMCSTVKSSGSRRGAMMATMADWHPDIWEFISAKREKGRLTNFNVSVMISDSFMHAVKNDLEWELGFEVEPADPRKLIRTTERNKKPWYVYDKFPARKLWHTIIENTYDWAEPGIIFIDRINQLNNLRYCETITSTNPCGEQPLPPNGDCNLGHVNLAGMVANPFSEYAEIDLKRIEEIARIGVRFLDNVLDISKFPTEAQQKEAINKRRTGLGSTGLANLLQQMRVRYGSRQSFEITEEINRTIALAAYDESAELAKERGPFPAYNKEKFMGSPFVKKLPSYIRDKIAKNGIRNGVLLTIAPVGTGSMFYGNISSGIEPTIFWVSDRNVLNDNGTFNRFDRIEEYGYRLYKHYNADVSEKDGQPVSLPSYMVTAGDLTVDEHLQVQAAAQKWIDASISKTINCPANMSFEDFEKVYHRAYELGLKGCTTYRPSDVRGSVITQSGTQHGALLVPPTRPEKLQSVTYKVKWPGLAEALYITISDIVESGKKRPFEIFINSKSVKHQEWITALTRCISAIFRRGGDLTFIVEELMQVHSVNEGFWIDQIYVPSIVAKIGLVVKQHMTENGEGFQEASKEVEQYSTLADYCPKCGKRAFIKMEGCSKCASCDYSSCD